MENLHIQDETAYQKNETAFSIQYNQLERNLGFKLFLLYLPYFIVFRLLIWPVSIIYKQGWKLLATKYLRYYFRIYYQFKGLISHFHNKDENDFSSDKPILILTTRRNLNFSLFSFLSLPFNAIIPISKTFLGKAFLGFLPWPLRSMLLTISYEDSPEDFNLDNIQTLLQNGYPVVAHINAWFADPRTHRTLFLFEDVIELLKRKDIDIYFLNHEGLELQDRATFWTPAPVQSKLTKANRLIKPSDFENPAFISMKIAAFFGLFKYKRVKISQL